MEERTEITRAFLIRKERLYPRLAFSAIALCACIIAIAVFWFIGHGSRSESMGIEVFGNAAIILVFISVFPFCVADLYGCLKRIKVVLLGDISATELNVVECEELDTGRCRVTLRADSETSIPFVIYVGQHDCDDIRAGERCILVYAGDKTRRPTMLCNAKHFRIGSDLR